MSKRRMIWVIGFVIFFLIAGNISEIFATRDGELYHYSTVEITPKGDPILLVTEDQIVLFYEESAILNFYDLDGNFQHGYKLATIRNGVGKMGYADGTIYVKVRGNCMFVIRDGQIESTVYILDDKDAYHELTPYVKAEPNHQHGDTTYAVTSGGIIRFGEGTVAETVIRFPQIRSIISTLRLPQKGVNKGFILYIVFAIASTAFFFYKKSQMGF